MQIIFLDIDGVLNAHQKLPSGYFGLDIRCVNHFNGLLAAAPDAKIVVSSAWRYMMLRGDMTLRGFEYVLLIGGVNCHNRIISHTAEDDCLELPHGDIVGWREVGLRMRAQQIQQWVADHKPKSYAVLDDLPLVVPNFVQTDCTKGLTELEALQCLTILSRQQDTNSSLMKKQ